MLSLLRQTFRGNLKKQINPNLQLRELLKKNPSKINNHNTPQVDPFKSQYSHQNHQTRQFSVSPLIKSAPQFKSNEEIVEFFIENAISKRMNAQEFKQFIARLPEKEKESFERLNPANSYPKEMVKDLFLKTKEKYSNLSTNAKAAFKRMLFEGASRGAINDETFQGITLLYNVLSMVAYDVTDPQDIPAALRKHSPGEGGIPPVGMLDEEPIYDDSGNLLFKYGPQLFESGKVQNASGMFLGAEPTRILIEKLIEIKDQAAKQGVGGRAPKEKVSLIVQALRRVLQRELPSPGQRQAFKSVEEEDINHIIAALFSNEETIVGSHGVIANPAAVQKVPSDTDAAFRAGAVIKAQIPVIITGDGGGTGKTEESFRRDVQQNSLLAALQTRVAFEKSKPDISVSGGMYGPKRRLLAYLLFSNVGGLTFPQMVSFGCIFAKLCHKSCPANLTTGKMDSNKIFDALDVMTNDLTLLAQTADDIGVDLSKGPLDARDLNKFVQAKDGTALAKLLKELQGKAKETEERIYTVITRTQDQIVQEREMRNNKSIPGSSSFTGLAITDVRRRFLANDHSEQTYTVGFAGTAAGTGLSKGQLLKVNHAGDFAGYFLSGGTIVANTLGRLAGVGAQYGQIFARDCQDGALFGASTESVVGSMGDFSGLFIKRGHVSVFPWFSKTGELNTVGDYSFNTNLGSTILMPKVTFNAIDLTPSFVDHNKVEKLDIEDFIKIRHQFDQANSYFKDKIDTSVIGNPQDWVKISPKSCANKHEQFERLVELNMLPEELSMDDFNLR